MAHSALLSRSEYHQLVDLARLFVRDARSCLEEAAEVLVEDVSGASRLRAGTVSGRVALVAGLKASFTRFHSTVLSCASGDEGRGSEGGAPAGIEAVVEEEWRAGLRRTLDRLQSDVQSLMRALMEASGGSVAGGSALLQAVGAAFRDILQMFSPTMHVSVAPTSPSASATASSDTGVNGGGEGKTAAAASVAAASDDSRMPRKLELGRLSRASNGMWSPRRGGSSSEGGGSTPVAAAGQQSALQSEARVLVRGAAASAFELFRVMLERRASSDMFVSSAKKLGAAFTPLIIAARDAGLRDVSLGVKDLTKRTVEDSRSLFRAHAAGSIDDRSYEEAVGELKKSVAASLRSALLHLQEFEARLQRRSRAADEMLQQQASAVPSAAASDLQGAATALERAKVAIARVRSAKGAQAISSVASLSGGGNHKREEAPPSLLSKKQRPPPPAHAPTARVEPPTLTLVPATPLGRSSERVLFDSMVGTAQQLLQQEEGDGDSSSRVALPDSESASEELELYIEAPSEEEVASSGSGSDDEGGSANSNRTEDVWSHNSSAVENLGDLQRTSQAAGASWKMMKRKLGLQQEQRNSQEDAGTRLRAAASASSERNLTLLRTDTLALLEAELDAITSVQAAPTHAVQASNDTKPGAAAAGSEAHKAESNDNGGGHSAAWKVGERCYAQWEEDDMWYEAQIEEVLEESKSFRVRFAAYGNSAVCGVAQLSRLPMLQTVPALRVSQRSSMRTVEFTRDEDVGQNAGAAEVTPAMHVQLRQEAILNLLQSEQIFVSQLLSVTEGYMRPLSEKLASKRFGKLTKERYSIIFSNVQAVLHLHKGILSNLAYRCTRSMSTLSVGDIFLQLLPQMETAYAKYVSSYAASVETLRRCLKADKKLRGFMEQCQEHGKIEQPLPQLLAKPLTRLLEYEVMLSAVLQHTEQSNADRDLLGRCIDQLQLCIEAIERRKEETGNLRHLSRLQNTITGNVIQIIMPGRRFYREGSLTLLPTLSSSGPGEEHQQMYWFLCSDVLLRTKKKSRQHYIFKELYTFGPLEGVNVRDVSSAECPHTFELYISSSARLLLRAPSEDEKNAWIRDIQSLSNTFINDNVSAQVSESSPSK